MNREEFAATQRMIDQIDKGIVRAFDLVIQALSQKCNADQAYVLGQFLDMLLLNSEVFKEPLSLPK